MPIENSSGSGSLTIPFSSPTPANVASFAGNFVGYNGVSNVCETVPCGMQRQSAVQLGSISSDTFSFYSANDSYCVVPQSNTYHAYLSIVEPPVSKMRFRYVSEKGSHGGLMGKSSTSDRKTFPTVKLENFHGDGQIIIKASLYTNEDKPKLHVHKLKGPHCDEDGICQVFLRDDFTAIFQNIGISFIGKKSVPGVLYQRKLIDYDHLQNPGGTSTSPLSESDKKRLKKEADQEAKHMNLNSAKICFEAVCWNAATRTSYPICQPVFSDPVSNQKSPDFGELRITRMNKYCGDCMGGDEVYLLCEKVNKKEVKIRFSERDVNGRIIWEGFGNFSEADVHHQVAIVFRTPAYKTTDIISQVPVQVQLFRQTDGEASEPVNFVYVPSDTDRERISRKRKKRINCEDSNGFSASESPFVSESLGYVGHDHPNFDNKGTNGNYHVSEDMPLMEDFDFDSLLNALSESDTSELPEKGLTESSHNPLLSSANIQLPVFPPAVLECQSFSGSLNYDGFKTDSAVRGEIAELENRLHVLAISSQLSPGASSASSSTSFESEEVLINEKPIESPANTLNVDNLTKINNVSVHELQNKFSYKQQIRYITKIIGMPYTKLIQKIWGILTHYIIIGRFDFFKKSAQLLLSITNEDGDNVIHLIVIHQGQNADLMKFMLRSTKDVSPNPVNFQNKMKQSPLHLAMLTSNHIFVSMLVKSGSDVCIRDKNGNLPLHLAAQNRSPNCLSELLKEEIFSKMSVEKDSKMNSLNYKGFSPLHCAIMHNSEACVYALCEAGVDVNGIDGRSGRSALHLAVEHFPAIINYLLSQPLIDVDIQDYAGNTPLHLACALKCSSTVQKLMNKNANPLVGNYDYSCENNDQECEEVQKGRTPFDFANGDEELKNIMSGFGEVKAIAGPFSSNKVNEKECFHTNYSNESKSDINKEKGDSGYISGSLLDEQTLIKVCNLLDPPSTEWRDLALWLGVEEKLLDSIEKLECSPTKIIIENFLSDGGDSLKLMNALENANLTEAQNIIKTSFTSH